MLDYIEPGKPYQNAFVARFNGKFRDGCLNEDLFVSLSDAQQIVEHWRTFYNTVRPHSSLCARSLPRSSGDDTEASRVLRGKMQDLSLSHSQNLNLGTFNTWQRSVKPRLK